MTKRTVIAVVAIFMSLHVAYAGIFNVKGHSVDGNDITVTGTYGEGTFSGTWVLNTYWTSSGYDSLLTFEGKGYRLEMHENDAEVTLVKAPYERDDDFQNAYCKYIMLRIRTELRRHEKYLKDRTPDWVRKSDNTIDFNIQQLDGYMVRRYGDGVSVEWAYKNDPDYRDQLLGHEHAGHLEMIFNANIETHPLLYR